MSFSAAGLTEAKRKDVELAVRKVLEAGVHPGNGQAGTPGVERNYRPPAGTARGLVFEGYG